jgi:4-methyl-5(b-hydroxyethyl)-thiazole monophosphate biosynthesis
MPRVAVLVADGFEEVEGVTVIDFLRRSGVEVTVAGVTGERITASRGVVVVPDAPVESLVAEELDAIVLPGGAQGAKNLAGSESSLGLVRALFMQGKLVGAICAAPAIALAKAGVLAGRQFTCYPGFEKNVSEGTFREDRVVVDGNLITSRAPGTAAEFAVALIKRLVGQEAADTIHDATLQK